VTDLDIFHRNMKIHLALLLLFLASFAFTQPTGGRIVLSTQGINNLLQKELPYIRQAVLDAAIPELSVQESVPVIGKVDVTITNMKINSVDFGPLSIGTQAPNIVVVGT
jgi:hypothetical protein